MSGGLEAHLRQRQPTSWRLRCLAALLSARSNCPPRIRCAAPAPTVPSSGSLQRWLLSLHHRFSRAPRQRPVLSYTTSSDSSMRATLWVVNILMRSRVTFLLTPFVMRVYGNQNSRKLTSVNFGPKWFSCAGLQFIFGSAFSCQVKSSH
jgi:hypothetical protein